MGDFRSVTVVIPSLDPDDKLHEVIRSVKAKGFSDILLVDDGSAPENQHYFETAEREMGCTVLHHPKNLGKGRALKTAFRWFMENRPDAKGCVTIDGDNQHHADDIAACSEIMLGRKEDALILGCRNFDEDNVPKKSKFGNKCTSFVFKVFCGLHVSDTQTGLRAFPRGIIPQMLEISGERFEYETNMLLACKTEGIPIVEQTIRTIYIDDNATTHFHPIKDSVRVYGMIIKFFISSLLSFLIDQAIYIVSYNFLFKALAEGARQFTSATLARILSSLFNFTMNRKAVFKSDAPLGITMAKYYILWGFQLLTSIALVYGLSLILPIKPTIIKPFVDFFLYFVSFRVQQAWVFKKAPAQKK